VTGGEFFHRWRAVRFDYPKRVTCLAIGVGSVAERFDSRRGHLADLLASRPQPIVPEPPGLIRDQGDDRADPERGQRVAAGCPGDCADRDGDKPGC